MPIKPEFSALELLSPAVDTDTPIKEYEKSLRSSLEAFKEIAPQDQEKVNEHCRNWEEEVENLYVIQWGPEIGKLYDSGDLVFELESLCQGGCKIGDVTVCHDKGCHKQFWVLKEKAKEEDYSHPLTMGQIIEQETVSEEAKEIDELRNDLIW